MGILVPGPRPPIVSRAMPRPKKATSKKRPRAATRSRRFVCPDCGFKAAHAMGLGRHRTSQHGVPSKRELAGRRSKRSDGAKIASLERRVAQLEKRYDELVTGLRRTAGAAKR